ncbi:MAG TPA: methionyl-tRNA formyltransferase [Lacunisphaera sp.]|nr:methionyl-tRNA formyltransferase [Lacunisphaera sp.]
MLRIVFMGSDGIALPALNWLAGGAVRPAKVVGVFTQPDRPAGRGQKLAANVVKTWALDRDIPVLQPERLGPAERDQLAALKPDLVLVMAYGQILRQEVIDTPRLGTFNLHTSLLPAYRGASPIQTAICCREKETGVTLMRMVLRLDAGPVAGAERVSIEPRETAADLERKLAHACVPLLGRCLPAIAAGTQEFTPQDEARATYCRRLEKTDGVLDFHAPAAGLAARVNGLAPWPGCTVEINSQTVKIGLADMVSLPEYEPAAPGEVMGPHEGGLLVGTGERKLRFLQLQRAGGRMLRADEFLRGFPVAPGTRLASLPMPPLVSARPFPRRTG